MEKPEEIESQTRKKDGTRHSSRRTLASPVVMPPTTALNLAAISVTLNVRLRSSDMSVTMQEKAFRFTRALLDTAPNTQPNPSHIALSLKKEFDASYGPAWHCVVGKSFGSYVTHSPGGFLYFSIDKLFLLLFKTEVRPVIESPPSPKLSK